MKRFWLTGAVAAAMVAGVAMAQDVTTSTTTEQNASSKTESTSTKVKHHPVESYEWSKDTTTETHSVVHPAPQVTEHTTTTTTQPAQVPAVVDKRTTTTTTTTGDQ